MTLKLVARHLENFVVVNRVHRCISATLGSMGKLLFALGEWSSSTRETLNCASLDGRICRCGAGLRTDRQAAAANFVIVPQMKIETIAVHAGHAVDPATGALLPRFIFPPRSNATSKARYSRGFMYTRNDNPNRQALERGVSALEGGEAAAAFASGTGATMAIFAGALAWRSRPCARRCLLRHVAIAPRTFPPLGTRSRFRGHERSGRSQESTTTKHKIGLGRDAIQSVAENCGPCSRCGNRARSRRHSAFATTHGHRCCNGHSISAPI